MKTDFTFIALIVAATFFSSEARAHFPWLVVEEDGTAVFFFGENPSDRTYKLPPSIANAVVNAPKTGGELSTIEMNAIDRDDFVGKRSAKPLTSDTYLSAKVTYGVYHGTRLDYYSQHIGGELTVDRKWYKSRKDSLELRAELVDVHGGVDVYILWKGKPLADAKVSLYCAEGHKEGEAKTGKDGKVSFNDKQVEEGLNGIVVGHTVEEEAGEIGEQSYSSVSHYLTATFNDPEQYDRKETLSVAVTSDQYPELLEPVTSFGAAVTDDALYVYGGHMGEAHQYYKEAQANTLWRLNLKAPKSWEKVSSGPRLQGLAMVAHQGKMYRIGGFTAKNKQGEDKDLWSQSNVSCFDPMTGEWQELPSLPEPRSSFDAAVLGDQIFVVGGWSLDGGGKTTWHKTAYSMDLTEQTLQWKPLPEPPFQRRALSVAAHDGKIYAIGGMQSKGGPTTRVDVFDTKANAWSRGPDLEGENMDGFGSSSFATGGKLYATTYSGSLQQLGEKGVAWKVISNLDNNRFFHRLLPLSKNQLIAVGGASMTSGKFESLDVISLP